MGQTSNRLCSAILCFLIVANSCLARGIFHRTRHDSLAAPEAGGVARTPHSSQHAPERRETDDIEDVTSLYGIISYLNGAAEHPCLIPPAQHIIATPSKPSIRRATHSKFLRPSEHLTASETLKPDRTPRFGRQILEYASVSRSSDAIRAASSQPAKASQALLKTEKLIQAKSQPPDSTIPSRSASVNDAAANKASPTAKSLRGSSFDKDLGDYYNYYYDYYDYKVPSAVLGKRQIEGSGQFGLLAQKQLNRINRLARDTPRLGSVSTSETAATGAQTAQYRNSTSVIQTIPPRTAGSFQSGSAAVDDTSQATFASGTSASAAKFIPSEKGPRFYSSAGESITQQRGISADPDLQTGSETAANGISTAGAQAIRGVTGFGFGPVIGIFNAGLRDGAFAEDSVVQANLGTATTANAQLASIAAFREQKEELNDANIGGAVMKSYADAFDKPGQPLASVTTVAGEPIPGDQNINDRYLTFGATNR